MDALTFEILLLDIMTESYKVSIQKNLNLSQKDLERIRNTTDKVLPLGLPSSIEEFRHIFSGEVRRPSSYFSSQDHLKNSEAFCYPLGIWPHLFWVVHIEGDSITEIGFCSQSNILLSKMHAELVLPGLWTFFDLEKISDSYEMYDGWGEEIVVNFEFGAKVFQGKFIFGLLNTWDEWT